MPDPPGRADRHLEPELIESLLDPDNWCFFVAAASALPPSDRLPLTVVERLIDGGLFSALPYAELNKAVRAAFAQELAADVPEDEALCRDALLDLPSPVERGPAIYADNIPGFHLPKDDDSSGQRGAEGLVRTTDRHEAARKAWITRRARANIPSITTERDEAILQEEDPAGVGDDFRDRFVAALEGAADELEVGGADSLVQLGIVPGWIRPRIGEAAVARFARAARHLAGEIERGLWDDTLPRCTADELLLQHCINVAEWGATDDGLDYSVDAESARETLLQDDDALMLWPPAAEQVLDTDKMRQAMPDLPSTEPQDWWRRFATTGPDREDP